MLAAHCLELQHGNEFYAQRKGTGDTVSPVPVPLAPPAACLSPADNGEEHEAPPNELPELSIQLLHFTAEYPDTAAWLQIPGSPVDYPVMIGRDNRFYLNHLPDGNKNALGSLFFDFRSNENSQNLIIYGHNGPNGTMFGPLKQYESQEFFSEHNTLTLVTSDWLYTCPVFSVRRTAADSNAYTLEFADKAALTEYINQAAAESLYPIHVDLSNTARVLTLSTCTNWPNQRFIVQAIIPG